MGKVASRCLNGCEGGKNEIGEENLEAIANPLKRFNEENQFCDAPIMVKTAHLKENELENLTKLLEDFQRKKK
jgi:hypothetical protein